MIKNALFVAFIAVLRPMVLWAEPAQGADIVIYGGTAAGVTAAVQAAKMGHSVVLLEPSRHLGGLTSGGLGMTDAGRKEAIGGLARQFYQRVKNHYQKPDSWKFEKPSEFKFLNESTDALWRFEPRVAEKILREMLAEHPVKVMEGERLDRKTGMSKVGARLASIRMESGKEFTAQVFIDATYEGDLLAAAGATYHVGRESTAQYDEKLNGVQLKKATQHQFVKPVDPYKTPGDKTSGLLPGVSAEPPGAEGAGDSKIQAYNFRLCMTEVAANKVPWPKPDGYDPLRYELGLRYALAGNTIWHSPDRMPNGKTDTNNRGGFSTDNIGMNYAYPEGDYATRARIISEHESYQKGFYYFFANDPRVPESVRKEFNRWGLAKDEFTDNGNWPHQLYIREARRLVGEYVHTEQDCCRTRQTPASVGLGSYNMDSHHVQRYVDTAGHARNEGDVQESPGGAYMISYRSLVPKRAECENLLVPVCVSSSHIAYGSIRMEPVFMILGQSVATAASMAIQRKIPVQDVPYEELKTRLLADGQVLVPPPNQTASKPAGISMKKLAGIVADDAQAERVGDWAHSNVSAGFVEDGYLHDADEAKGEKSVKFHVILPKAGNYELRVYFPPNANRAPNAPVSFQTLAGIKTATIDQRKASPASLGVHSMPAGKVTLTLSNTAAKGFVVADAVEWLPAK